MLRVLALDPWYAGSHARFLDAWRARSAHRVTVVGLAGRYWRWRMAAGAWELARRLERDGIGESSRPDVLLVSDFVDLAGLRGFLPASWADVPAVLYFHENQLTYPERPSQAGRLPDFSPGFTNILSCITAQRVVFNSRYHLDAFGTAAKELLATLPKPNPRPGLEDALARAEVIAPGVDLESIPLGPGGPGAALRVVFNHRWEHDKDPAAFLDAVSRALQRGAQLELALLGESFADLPEGVAERLARLQSHVVHAGFEPSRADYHSVLGRGDILVSTARHEFFGISTVEGVAAGCTPLVPNRLSYPGLLEPSCHERCLYADDEDLVDRLVQAAGRVPRFRDPEWRADSRASVLAYDVAATAGSLDRVCADVL